MHATEVLEVALFEVKPGYEAGMPALREGLRQALRDFPGLLELQTYSPLANDRVFADIARWDSLENAQAAATAFAAGDPRFAPYMEAIHSLRFMGHFRS